MDVVLLLSPDFRRIHQSLRLRWQLPSDILALCTFPRYCLGCLAPISFRLSLLSFVSYLLLLAGLAVGSYGGGGGGGGGQDSSVDAGLSGCLFICPYFSPHFALVI